jgi:hypothetical protein
LNCSNKIQYDNEQIRIFKERYLYFEFSYTEILLLYMYRIILTFL